MQRDYSRAMDVRTNPNGMGATTLTIKRRTRVRTDEGGTKNHDVLVMEGVPAQYNVPRPAQLARAEQQAGGKLIATVIVAFTIPNELDGAAITVDPECFLILKAWGTEPEQTFWVRAIDVAQNADTTVIATLEE